MYCPAPAAARYDARHVAERTYAHRDVLDKLGIKPGQALQCVAAPVAVPAALQARVIERLGRPLAAPDEPIDVVLVAADDSTDAVEVLRGWRPRLHPSGGIWLLTPKRGQAGYVDQRELIAAGAAAGLVDNKVCSVSDALSALRFVIRKADRVYS